MSEDKKKKNTSYLQVMTTLENSHISSFSEDISKKKELAGLSPKQELSFSFGESLDSSIPPHFLTETILNQGDIQTPENPEFNNFDLGYGSEMELDYQSEAEDGDGDEDEPKNYQAELDNILKNYKPPLSNFHDSGSSRGTPSPIAAEDQTLLDNLLPNGHEPQTGI